MNDLRYVAALAALSAALLFGCDRTRNPLEGPRFDHASGGGSDPEPNNTCPTAHVVGVVVLPFSLTDNLNPVPPALGDVDFYQFAGTPNSLVRVDLEGQSTGQGSLGDPFLGFFDSGCALIAINDDNGINLNSRLTITIPADGIFVLAVTRCCDFSFTEGGIGSYRLTVADVPPLTNDAFANATVVPALPFSAVVDLSAASVELGEPTPPCAVPYGPLSSTAWYAFTAAATRSITARVNAPFPTVVAAYTGTALLNLVAEGCGVFGGGASFRALAGTTYYFQVGGLFGASGQLEFILEVTPPPVANFGFFPFDPSVFDVVQFFDFSFDPGGTGFASQEWDFGDATTATGCCPTHRFAADGDYAVQLTVTTFDGRSASAAQTASVRTHDVAITRFGVPNAASSGQTRPVTVGVNSKRQPETVEVQLFRSTPGGFAFIGVLVQAVPVRPSNRTTDFNFSYTFTGDDAQIGKVTFRAVANLVGARDALPADNEAIAAPTKMNK